MKFVVTFVIAFIGLSFLGIWSGMYNVAAKDKHWSITTSLLELVRERSIKMRSADLNAPDLDNIKLIKEGAEHYAQMCTECHLAPGMSETELYSGLYPQPPVFNNSNYNGKPEKQFWVIKNGLKMTGMPAWSPAHTDEQIWAMVAFLQMAKTLSDSDYQELSQTSSEGHNHSHGATNKTLDNNNDTHNHKH